MNTESIPTLQENKNIKAYNTFGVDCMAEYYARVDHLEQLQNVLGQLSISYNRMLILGGGSNLLFVGNYGGIVLHNAFKGIEVLDEDAGRIRIQVGAGMNWHRFVTYCVEREWGGIENLALIPGRVGAAPIQNIGAYGVEFEDVFESLRAVHLKSGEVEAFDNEECRFGYRDSIFKGALKGQYLITDITLILEKNKAPDTSYDSLSNHLMDQGIHEPGIEDVFRAVVDIRQSKLPDPDELGNAGSFFKNPVITSGRYESLEKEFGEVPGYPEGNNKIKVPAAWLIDKAGWRGVRRGEVGTYPHQALVIVNYGGATGAQILEFAAEIRSAVFERFEIKLDPEVNIITTGDQDWKRLLIN